jgi:integrase
LAVIKSRGVKATTKQFERKIDAEAWEREGRVHLGLVPQSQAQRPPEMTVSELASHWLSHHAQKRLEGSSVHRYEGMLRRYLLPEFGAQRIAELSPVQVDSWLTRLASRDGLAAKTANSCLGLLRKMVNDAVHWRFLAHSPISAVRPLKEDERDFCFWTVEEAEAFLAHARAFQPAVFYPAAIALYSGLRLGEIQALQWDCIDFGGRLITVKRSFCQKEARVKERTKTKKIRRVPINASLAEVLIELKNRGTPFVAEGFDYHHASRVLRQVAKAADVKPIRFHDLRHSFASNFVMRGGSIYKLQRLLGHSSIQMTERYSHLSPDHLADATAMLDFGTRQTRVVVSLSRAVAGGLTKS